MMNNNDNLNNNTLNSNLNNNNNFNNNTLNSNLNNNNNFNNNNNLNNNNLNNNNLNDEKDEKYEKIKDKVINVMSNITYQMTDPFNPHKEEQKERIINNTSEDIKKSLNIITNNIQETADAFGFTTEKRRREKEELKKKHDALFEKYANNNIPKETQQLWRNVNNEINNNNSNFKLLQTSLKRDIKKSWNLIKDSVIPTDHNNNNNNNNYNNYNNNNYNNYNEKLIKSDVDDKTKKVWRNVNNEIKNNNKIGLSKIAKNAWNNIITEINSNKMVNSVESAKKVISNLSTSLKNLDVASVQASIQTSLNDTVQKAKNSLEIFNKDAHNNNINNNNNQPIVREDGTTLRLIPVSEKAQKVFSAGNNNSNSNSNNNEAGVAHLLSTQQPITPQPVEQTKTDVNNNDTMVNDTMVNDTMVNDINFDVRKQEINNNEAQERNL